MHEPPHSVPPTVADPPGPVPAPAPGASLAGPALEVIERFAHAVADAVVVTNLDRRVIVWNPAAEALYGIARGDALGSVIDELYDSRIAGQGTHASRPRGIAIADGQWRGRVVERPRLGSLVGRDLVIETVLSRLDEDGRPAGIVSIKRDVTDAVRLEQELATLGSLATTTELARSPAAIAGNVLDLLMSVTGATSGVILSDEDGGARIEAARGLAPDVRAWVEDASLAASPLSTALRTPGTVVSGPVRNLPMQEESRVRLIELGVAALAAVGLHRQGVLAGLLILAFDEEHAPRPSNATLMQAAIHVQRALDNARLLEELERRAAVERRLVDQQLALQSLTELSANGDDFRALAERTVRQVATVLGAVAGSYTLLAPDGTSLDWFAWNVPPDIVEAQLRISTVPTRPLERLRTGEGPYATAFTRDAVTHPGSLELARAAGWSGYAALPVDIADRLEGIILVYFDRPLDALDLEPRLLRAIARLVSISLGNFRLRERLSASERRYRTLFEASPEPYIVEDVEGRIVDANAAAGVLFGGGPETLRGLTLEQHVRLSPEELADRRARVQRDRHGTFRGIGVRVDGSTFPEEAIVSIVHLDGEERTLVHVRDLSERERLQQELIQAQKMDAIGQLVSGVAHELNNPLAAILGFSQLIRRDERLPEELVHNADLLVEEATRTRRIVQNLLDFARQRPPERFPTSIRALVDAVLLLQSYSLGPGRIEVTLDIPNDLPPVELDRSQIQQVLVNLTQNAIYSVRAAGGGRLGVSARLVRRADGDRVRIAVSDDGAGVDPEHVRQLFVPFFTTKPPSEGTGLGLPVSYGIVASHDGELAYVPPVEGTGAVFAFDLPVKARRPEAGRAPGDDRARGGSTVPPPPAPEWTSFQVAPPGSPGSRPAGRGRILVIDDERSIRLLLEKWLRGTGYEPLLAATGEEALDIVRRTRIDAVLCDHRMAGMTGTQAFEAIVAVRPELDGRFVFMSGDVLNPQLRDFVLERGIGLLAKPFDLEAVNRTLRTVLEAGRVAPA